MAARHEDRPESHARLASHFLATFPQLEDVRFTHRWAGAIDTCTQFTAFYGLSHDDRVAHAAGFTGLGVGATRFAAEVLLDLLAGEPTERTSLRMVRERPLPFPPEPLASVGINLTRWSLDRADHRRGRRNAVPARPRRGRPRLRQLISRSGGGGCAPSGRPAGRPGCG